MYPGETQEFCLQRLDSRSEPDEDISRFFFETNVFAIDELLYHNNNIPPHVSVACDEAINAATDSSKQVAEEKNSESNPADRYTNSTMENRSSIKPPQGSTTASTESALKQHAVAKPVKDMVVLRSRRGQATNKHSIAERVRREKIKKRMNCLQDLVPGCHKGAAKTIILDQIINYIKSLQYQIEFLSMKLSAASTRYSFSLEPGQGNDDLRSTLVCKPASLFQP